MECVAAPGEALETAAERRQRWRSVYVIYFTMFQMSLGFSIVLTGVWPYLDKVLTALFFYATGCYQRPVGVAKHLSQKMCSVYIEEVTSALTHNNIVRKYIRFPENLAARQAISQRFHRKYGIPGVVGCIDGSHFKIVVPHKEEEHIYYSRKHYHSLNVQMLAPGSSKESLGLAVGASPLGQLLASPLLGWWANRAGGARAPMLCSLALFVLASALYALLHLARPHALGAMLAARALVGVASANVAVARAYLSAATLQRERTRAVAGAALAQVLGFVVGPALQAAAAPLGPGAPYGPADWRAPLRLDMYTAPGWANALLGLLNLLLFLPGCFTERCVAAREAMLQQGRRSEKEALRAAEPDLVSSWTLVGAFFVLVFNFVLLETLATSLTMDQFAWSKRQALQYMGALMSAGALVACLVFALIAPLTKLFEERALLLWGGFLLTGLASLLCIPWGPGPPPLAPDAVDAAGAADAEAPGGCPARAQPWCASSRALMLPQFLLGYACVAVGYPLGVTLIQTIFSKVLGPRPQGVWMGVLTGAGCVSRALGPVFVATVYARRGPTPTFCATAALTFAALLALRLVYARLAPPSPPPPPPPPPQELQPLRARDPPA